MRMAPLPFVEKHPVSEEEDNIITYLSDPFCTGVGYENMYEGDYCGDSAPVVAVKRDSGGSHHLGKTTC